MRGIYVSTGKDKPTRFTFTIPQSKLNELTRYCKDKMNMADFIRQSIEEKMKILQVIKKEPDIVNISVRIEEKKDGKWVTFFETDESGITYQSYSMSPSFFESFFNDCLKMHKKLFKVKKRKNSKYRRLE